MLVFELFNIVAQANTTPIFLFGPQLMPLWIIIPGAISAIFYFAGKHFNIKLLRLAAFLPLLVGFLVGMNGVLQLGDTLYRDFNDITSKRELVHYAIVAFPVLAAGALAFLEFFKGGKNKRQL